jgi:hypothetical protein
MTLARVMHLLGGILDQQFNLLGLAPQAVTTVL